MAASHGDHLPSCSTDALERSDYLLINPLSLLNSSGAIDNDLAPAGLNSNYNMNASSSSEAAPSSHLHMQQAQALMNASLHQPSHAISVTYCPPAPSKVLECECLPAYYDEDGGLWQDMTVLPTDINEIIRDSDFHNLPELPPFDCSVFMQFNDEYFNMSTSMDSTPEVPHELAPMENQAILSPQYQDNFPDFDPSKIDLPNLVPASSSMSGTSASLVAPVEIKDVISWAADSFDSTSNIGSPMEIASLPTATSQLPYSPTSVPPSPTQSNNANEDNMESSSKVTIMVKTEIGNLHDGYVWRKYGEKTIKEQRFRRSYFRCGKKGCKVVKRTERCSKRQEYMMFTYLGRHDHHP